jgi:phosphoenolpyruvate---glycerone phosphotransferase subunit DhaL
MAENVSFDRILKAVRESAEELRRQKEYFNDLDSQIGDSDHGDSIDFTFKKVLEKLDAFDVAKEDIGALLVSIGRGIILSGGAAMGPLYGTAFVEAGKTVEGKTQITFDEFVCMWEGFVSGIEKRGGVKVGEKTMFDTVVPAVNALREARSADESFSNALRKSIVAAESGMNSTKEMNSKRGRSSRLGERSVGHIDPGSASMCVFLSKFFEIVDA